jgi:dipeptidyl aminopeptidase/acylaminoacyl peptidase
MEEQNIEKEIVQPQPTENLPIKKKKPWLMIILIVLIIISLGTVSVFAYQNYLLKNQTKTEKNTLIQITPTTTVNNVASKTLFSDFAYIGKDMKSIYTCDKDGSNVKKVYSFPNDVGTGGLTTISFSKDKNWVAFTVLTLPPSKISSSLYIMKNDLTGLKKLNTNNLDFAGNTQSPTWSPDEKKIALSGAYGQEWPQIYSIDLESEALTKLTNNNYTNKSPTWSPDGKHIAFASLLPGADYHIFIMDSDGTKSYPLGNMISQSAAIRYVTDSLIASLSVNKLDLINIDGTVQKTILPPSKMYFSSYPTVGNGFVYISISESFRDPQPQTLVVDSSSGNTNVLTNLISDSNTPIPSN